MERALVLLLLAGSLFASNRTYQANDLSPLNMPPLFQNDYLIVRGGGDHEFQMFGPDGAPAYHIDRPANARLLVNAAVDSDGTAAVAVEIDDRNGAISLFSREGTLLRTFNTREFVPSYIAFGADHSIWAAARGQLRHFSLEGKDIGVFGTYSTDLQWQEPVVQFSALRVSGDRVGYLMNPTPGKDLIWVEFNLEGKELGRWAVPGELIRMPPIFVGGKTFMWTATGIEMLDRAAGKWTPTSIPVEGILVGADQDALVFADRHGRALHWVSVDGR